ncbi:hypothetical protein AB0H37_24720 [Actinomadura sp. NPDC023710]|uniref:hypothetical protein n=1 Tax=Actinomadura sp. NPDC023710 TaxID=3158219 RepID=UPI0033CFE205
MDDLTVVEDLLTAAQRLRKTAQGTTPTPWRVHLRYYRKSPNMLAGAEFETPQHTSGISLKYPHVLADKQWKALASPVLAEPLARAFESLAATILKIGLPPDGGLAQHLIDLARTLLGRTP